MPSAKNNQPTPDAAPEDATRVLAGLAIRRVPLSALHQDPANVRVHGDKNLSAIVASLKEFGQVEPLVIQKSTGKIIGGNGRVDAMIALGWTDADIVELDIDHVKATALGIALNRTGELATWDYEGLAALLRTLQDEPGFDLETVRYTDNEVDSLIAGLSKTDGDVVDDPEGEWEGMPEFQHEDKTSKFRVVVHLRSDEDLQAFEELVGQKVPHSRWAIWYPRAEVIGHGHVE